MASTGSLGAHEKIHRTRRACRVSRRLCRLAMKPEVGKVHRKAQSPEQEKSQDKYEQQKSLAAFPIRDGTPSFPWHRHHGWISFHSKLNT
jgi:hypothetical protein